MKTILLLSFSIVLWMGVNAQVSKVTLQAAGLTCSMCSNAIHKALKTLEFVTDVQADIRTYSFEISFKENSSVDFDQVRRKVEKAGFTVTSFVAIIHFDNVAIRNSQPVLIGDKTFLFSNTTEQILNGDKRVKILNPGFISTKENKKTKFSIPASNTYHATI